MFIGWLTHTFKHFVQEYIIGMIYTNKGNISVDTESCDGSSVMTNLYVDALSKYTVAV